MTGISNVDLTIVEKREITDLIVTVSLIEEYLLLMYRLEVGFPSAVRSMITMAESKGPQWLCEELEQSVFFSHERLRW
jgi:hypothetical protein